MILLLLLTLASISEDLQAVAVENCNIISSGEYEFKIGELMYLQDGNEYTVTKKTTIERKEYTIITYCVRLGWK